MKRVQIAGRSGRAYFDGMGNVMYTIGDYTPNIGGWVVTDGRYIYGHTTGGGEGVITVGDMCVPIMLGREGPIEE
jgi:hypothetical protein